ncbi:MAG: metallophosphoesterase family protein, partial [Candidatus Njordarchaeales archaeon]
MTKEKIRIVHLADTHIDPTFRYLGVKQYERKKDFLQAFQYAVKKTLELKPDILLISGDLYDKVNPRNPARTIVMRALRRIHHEGIEIYAISGNHDTPRSIEEGASPLHEIEASGFIKYFSKTSEIEAHHTKVGSLYVCISGASFNHTFPDELDPLEAMTPPIEGDINISILHYNIAPIKVKPIWAAPTIKETSIPKELHYLALGHIHKFQKIRVGNTWIIYPGSTERRSFAEEREPKGFVYLELSCK